MEIFCILPTQTPAMCWSSNQTEWQGDQACGRARSLSPDRVAPVWLASDTDYGFWVYPTCPIPLPLLGLVSVLGANPTLLIWTRIAFAVRCRRPQANRVPSLPLPLAANRRRWLHLHSWRNRQNYEPYVWAWTTHTHQDSMRSMESFRLSTANLWRVDEIQGYPQLLVATVEYIEMNLSVANIAEIVTLRSQ